MIFDLDKPVKAYMFGSVTQRHGYWSKGRRLRENLILYCTKGSLSMEIDGKAYHAEHGDLLLIPRGVFYRPLECSGCKYYFFHFLADASEKTEIAPPVLAVASHPELDGDDHAYTVGGEAESLVSLSIHTRNVSHKIPEIFEKADALKPGAFFSDRLMLDALLRELLIIAGAQAQETEHGRRLSQILSYIGENYAGNVTLSSLAGHFGLSESYVARLFRTGLGMKPSEYINRIRASAAVPMLTGTDLTVTEIAEKVGYSSVYYFSRAFRRYLGKTPMSVRNGRVENAR